MPATLLTDGSPPARERPALPGPATAPVGRAGRETAELLDAHRGELVAHCARVLGSAIEAEDAAQEALVRAWRAFDGFQARSGLRTWLYRIATNVCIDLRRAPQRRAAPADPIDGSAVAHAGEPPSQAGGCHLVGSSASAGSLDPGTAVERHDDTRRALARMVTLLPPRQRAVLVLREVLQWSAADTATLLDTSVASVNSALQRARATVSAAATDDGDPRGAPGLLPHLDRCAARLGDLDATGLVELLLRAPGPGRPAPPVSPLGTRGKATAGP